MHKRFNCKANQVGTDEEGGGVKKRKCMEDSSGEGTNDCSNSSSSSLPSPD